MDKKQNQIEKPTPDPRSATLNRFGKVSEPIEDRMYQTSTPGSPIASIEDLKRSLKGRYDMLVLHDTIDDCLLLNMETGEVGVIPCRLHHAPK